MMSVGRTKLYVLVCVLVSLFVLTGSGYAEDDGPGFHQKTPVSSPENPDESSYPLGIYLAVGSFDPLRQTPNLPDALSLSPEQAAVDGTYIVQFNGPVLEEWKQALVEAGVQIGDYIPDYAFLAHMSSEIEEKISGLSFVRWVGVYQPGYRIAPQIAELSEAEVNRSYRVLTAPWADPGSLETNLSTIGSDLQAFEGGYLTTLSRAQVSEIARVPGVIWIEPLYLQEAFNDVAGGTIMGGATAWNSGYTGSGVWVNVTDTGLDTGDAGNLHQDFSGRVNHISSWPVVYANYGGGCEVLNQGADDLASDLGSGHGTHVTGSAVGNGARSNSQFKGLAYEAGITFQAVEQYTDWSTACPFGDGYALTGIPIDVRDLLNQAYTWGARIQNDSWGGGDAGVYDAQSRYFDDFIANHGDFAVVVAAGNDGEDRNGDGYVDENSISSPASAKNIITVGASDNERTSGGYASLTWNELWGYPTDPTSSDLTSDNRGELAAFSSRGPMNDGRIKPDVVAPGTNIISTKSSQSSANGWGAYNQYYFYDGGTSMASPLTAGAAALVREYYMTTEGLANPSAALIKATLINTAVDIPGYGNSMHEAGQPIPNNHEGWGRVDVGAATNSTDRAFVDDLNGVTTGAAKTYSYNVAAGKPFKVSLVWSDAPATTIASKALVNNLNLRVTAPNGTIYHGNAFSGGWSQPGGTADETNNVENVYVQSPAAGSWKVEVIGQNVPQGPQDFALVLGGKILNSIPLELNSITPDHAPNNGVQVLIAKGVGFEDTSTLQLKRGSTTIQGTGTAVNLAAGTITANFNLNHVTPGYWDVVATNSTSSATLKNGFLVWDASLPDLAINKKSLVNQVNPGDLITYTLDIKNQGLVTATQVTFTDTLPAGVQFASLTPACLSGPLLLPHGFACTIDGVITGTLAPDSSIAFTLVVTVSQNTRGYLINRVTVGSLEPDALPTDNTDQASNLSGPVGLYIPFLANNFPPVPGTPVLSPISNPDGDGSYVLNWTAGSGSPASSFDIEENGTIIKQAQVGTSYSVTGKTPGTYTYRIRGRNSNGVSPWSSPQSVPVIFTTNAIKNWNFENGRDGSWVEYSKQGFFLIDNPPSGVTAHSGSWIAWLGGADNEEASITQQVFVPAGVTTVHFWYWIESSDVCGYDFARVNVSGNTLLTFDLCGAHNTSRWVEGVVNVSAYVGQTIALQFYIFTDDFSSSGSNFFLDDVTFR